MYEQGPPSNFTPYARPPRTGCLAKGCLTVVVVVVLLGVILGGLGWYAASSFLPFFSEHPALIRIYPATEAQYETVLGKVDPFADSVKAGHGATLSMSADDCNILVARSPQFHNLRGRAYLTINHNELAMDASFPFNPAGASNPGQKLFFNGRVIFEASFSGGDVTFVVRRLEPVNGGPTPPLAAWLIGLNGFSEGFSRAFNKNFREGIYKSPAEAAVFDRIRTVIIKDDQIVATVLDSPHPIATPADPR